ncbi:hypothetical protein Mgra_00003419, partial [Meloidogyne graminicola]
MEEEEEEMLMDVGVDEVIEKNGKKEIRRIVYSICIFNYSELFYRYTKME